MTASQIIRRKVKFANYLSLTLDISTRQVERLLDRYSDDQLHEAVGIERSDKGQHRIGDYWQEYVRGVFNEVGKVRMIQGCGDQKLSICRSRA